MKVTILGIDAERKEIISFVGQKIDRVQQRFKLSGAEISVWLRDINGPRGGVDQECSIRLCRANRSPLIAKCRHSSVRAAILGSVARLRRVLASSTMTRSPVCLSFSEGGSAPNAKRR